MTEKDNNIPAVIVKGVGGLYTIQTDEMEEYLCLARGKFRYEDVTPLVGDRVVIMRNDRTEGESKKEKSCDHVIDSILERKNSLIRPALANLTHLFIVIPSAKPAPDLLTVDKLVSIAESKEIEPVIVINKTDLDPENASAIGEIYRKAGFACFMLSAGTGEGCGKLLEYFESERKQGGMLAAFAGASAAGKSTLMNRLFSGLDLESGEVSRKTQRGRHTTRHAELFPVFGDSSCFIADTPGFSMLDFTRFNFFELSELSSTFREFRDSLGKCRYTKCTHTKEEGCAILERVRNGEISKQRHDSYLVLYEEIKKKPEWKRKKESGVGH